MEETNVGSNEEKSTIIMEGKITSGLERGKYFLSKKGYRKRVKDKIGIDPKMGTLNIKLNDTNAEKLKRLKDEDGYYIEGFEYKGEEYGGVKLFPAEIGGLDGAVVIPDMSHYDRTLELISDHPLRDELDLTDGEVVQVVVNVP
ncbi:MAG: DUF120 domain-containing protein [Thermoplasmata archaeon]